MPSRPEVLKMTIDPMQWLTDYKVGNQYRYCNSSNGTTFSRNNQSSSDATQVWLMGDGTNDAYAKMRNQVYPALQSRSTLDLNSMVSSDIETIDIDGLSD